MMKDSILPSHSQRALPLAVLLSILLGMVMPILRIDVASASSHIVTAAFDAQFVKGGNTVVLNVTTPAARCVKVSGAHTGEQKVPQSQPGKTSWQFTFPTDSAASSGTKTVVVQAWGHNNCTNSDLGQANPNPSYILDNTPPTLTGSRTPAPNADGWNNGNVTVAWTCSDAHSGIASGACPAAVELTGEGANQSVTRTIADNVGNSTTSTVGSISIDKTRPVTSVGAVPEWNNTNVQLTLSAADGLSGVAATRYSLNGGAIQSGTSVSISGQGTHTLEFWSEDRAGNVEAAKSVQVKIDNTPPTISAAQSPARNGNGWNNSDVTVTFTCDDDFSGIASCVANGSSPAAASRTIASEGNGQQVSGTATDNAGNSATAYHYVYLDKGAPTISATPNQAANSNGWYKEDVTVSFSCNDTLSGIDSCPAAVTLGEGANQSVNGTATDNAGNSASASVSGINIDKSAPTISGQILNASPDGWYRDDVVVRWSCSDAGGSGLEGDCPADTVITGTGAGLSASASISDRAGNTATAMVNDINIDRTAPTITGTILSTPTNGWYTGDVTVRWSCSDGESESGLAGACPADSLITGEGRGRSVSVTIHDLAGNSASATVTTDIDRTPPAKADEGPTSAPNGNGWYTSAVVNRFTATDPLSGLADPDQADFTVSSGTAEGSAVRLSSGSADDMAGNRNPGINSAAFKIDLSNPAASITAPADGASTTDSSVLVQVNASDSASGVAQVLINGEAAALSGGRYSRSVNLQCGANAISAQATDNAGRQSSAASINVTRNCQTWKLHGYYSPIDMKDASGNIIMNTARAGSTVPVKFNIRDEAGNELTDASKISVRVTKVSCSNIAATLEDAAPTTSNPAGLHWDTVAKQWVFNWGTKGLKVGECFRILATDGTNAYPANNEAMGNAAHFRLR